MIKAVTGIAVFALCGIGLAMTWDYRPKLDHEYVCNLNGWCKLVKRDR